MLKLFCTGLVAKICFFQDRKEGWLLIEGDVHVYYNCCIWLEGYFLLLCLLENSNATLFRIKDRVQNSDEASTPNYCCFNVRLYYQFL